MKNKYVKLGIYIGTIVLAIAFLLFFIPGTKKVYNERFKSKVQYPHIVKVLEILDEYEELDYFDEECKCYLYRCKIVKGFEDDQEGEILVIQKIENQKAYRAKSARVGNKIYVGEYSEGTRVGKYTDVEWEFTGVSTTFNRIIPLIILVAVFCIAIIGFSRVQGVNTLIALFLSIAVIFIIYIPQVLLGGNIYFYTMITFLYVIIVTLLLVIGFNKKALCALIGCLGGVIVITILTLIVQYAFSLTGDYDNTTYELHLFADEQFNVDINLSSIIFSMITLGSMGALLDVGISLSSSLYEVSLNAHSAKEITKSGFSIGKDMLGTMTNTLILAYLGTSLPLVLYDILYMTLEGIFRLEVIYIEIIQSLVGTLGMLSIIPITSIICGLIYKEKKIILRNIFRKNKLNNE